MPVKKPYHATDLRNRLLDEALEELAKEGVSGFSLRKVSKASGVSRMAPYRHFESKEALLGELLTRGMQALASTLRSAAEMPDSSARGRLEALCSAYLLFAKENRAEVSLMFSEAGYAALREACLDGSAARGGDSADGERREADGKGIEADAFGVLEGAVAACQAEGSLDPEVDPAALSILLWSCLHGLALLQGEGVIASMAAQRGLGASEAEAALARAFGAFFREPSRD
jgi:AcrR family transcriptional regulator